MEKNIIEALNWRYATKMFDKNKKVSDVDLNELLEALRLTPSSFGLQAWKFLVVTNPEIRKEIRQASWDQPQVTDASHLIVLCAKDNITQKDATDYVSFAEKEHSLPSGALNGFKEYIAGFLKNVPKEYIPEWSKRQTYIALGNLMTVAALKQIDSCPMEGFDPEKVTKILNLDKTGYNVVTLCPIGYRSNEDSSAKRKKVRFPKEKVIEMRE